jgi:polar amino acid transport system substrate-binding protein
MVDLCNEIGKRSGLTMEIEPVVWSALIPSLTTKKIDMIAAAMYITDKRKEVIDFSNPIYTYGEGLIVQKTNTKDFVAFSDMKGFTVGAQVGTAYIDPLKTAFGEDKVRIYDGSMDGVLGDIATGRLDAGFLDYPQVAYALTKGAFPNVRLVKSYKSILTGSVGIGVRKGDKELVTKINSGLAAIQADGTLKKILAKWGID